VLLWETMRVTGVGRGLADRLARWRAPRAVHDPGKIVADLAAAVALGGDCLADIAVLREQPELAGPVASDPVVSRLVSALAADLPRALKAIRSARAAARERAWALAGENAPGADGGLVTVDLDATIVIAHSEKEQAAPTWKKTFGFHPLAAFADHGAAGNGEPLAIMLRTGGAGCRPAADRDRLASSRPGGAVKSLLFQVLADCRCLASAMAFACHRRGRSCPAARSVAVGAVVRRGLPALPELSASGCRGQALSRASALAMSGSWPVARSRAVTGM
jgi:hypothetical protein